MQTRIDDDRGEINMRACTAQTTGPQLIIETVPTVHCLMPSFSVHAAIQCTPLSLFEWHTYLQLQGNGEVDKFWVSDASKVKGLACTLRYNDTWVNGVHHNLQTQSTCPPTTVDTLAKPLPSV